MKIKFVKKILFLLSDILAVVLVDYLAFIIIYGPDYQHSIEDLYLSAMYTAILVCVVAFAGFGLYRSIWRYANFTDVNHVLMASVSANAVLLAMTLLFKAPFSLMVNLLFFILITDYAVVSRFGHKLIITLAQAVRSSRSHSNNKIMIIGAGNAGSALLSEFHRNKTMGVPAIFVDDDPVKQGSYINGVRVAGGRDDIPELCKKHNIYEIIIAIPSLSKSELRPIVQIAGRTSCKLKLIPDLSDIIGTESSNLNQMRDIQLEDLLGRDPVTFDKKKVIQYLKNRIVMVTGGGGSICSELCCQIAAQNPAKLIILDIYENTTFELEHELKAKYPELDFEAVIASVTDSVIMEKIMERYRPHTIFHAAAHKHVPLMENNPEEAIRNNVFGTLTTARLAAKYNTKRFIMVSTDKAVNPTSVMGATKRLAEMIVQAMNKISDTEFVSVRFGNVLGSNGSVIPLFKRQIEAGGPVTVTHPEMMRYFMTIPEAVQLLILAGSIAKGGEVFVLDMGEPVRISDLARDLIRLSGLVPDVDIKIEYVGLRPGEKLYEDYIRAEESATATQIDSIYICKPRIPEYDALISSVNVLGALIAKDAGSEALIQAMRALIPTYKDNSDYNDKIIKLKSKKNTDTSTNDIVS